MWHGMWPDRAVEDVPIGHVTNGVHVPTWVGAPMRRLLDARSLRRRIVGPVHEDARVERTGVFRGLLQRLPQLLELIGTLLAESLHGSLMAGLELSHSRLVLRRQLLDLRQALTAAHHAE